LIEPLVELAYNREFAGKGKVRYGGAETETSLKGGSFEASVGLSMQLADNLYWHALGTYEKGNKLSAWGLNAGIRLGFGGSKKK
ncbi:MAG: autotransporter domain-containing protein, partial [Elusimicrobiaceae bacterium]|nr:autotransporter domain-containing protein [Elusimicrobiaceae bacterium]